MIPAASRAKSSSKSRTMLSADDYQWLSALVQSRPANLRTAHFAKQLADDLGRAHIFSKNGTPEQIVCMNCEVEFRNDNTGLSQQMILVYLREASIGRGRLSVLTPVGTALIGLRVGDSTTWESRAGQSRKLTVLSVRHSRQ